MLGLFGLFGRAPEMQRLDDAFAATRVRARTVPDAVKLTMIKLLKEAKAGAQPDLADCASAAALVGFCMLGEEEFAKLNGPEGAAAAETRLMAAIESERSFDARLVLLTLEAGITHPGLVDRFNLSVE